MTTNILGSYVFSDTPTVNGQPVMLTDANTPSISSGLLSARPAAGTSGRIYVTTDTHVIYQDNGTTWDALTSSGVVLQSLTSTIAAITGTTSKTDANTTPVITDGTQIWSQIITPATTASRIAISGSLYVDHGTSARRMVVALFRGSTCIGVAANFVVTTGRGIEIPISFVDSPATTAATTYTMRMWANGAGTWYLAQNIGPFYNGMLARQAMVVQEFA